MRPYDIPYYRATCEKIDGTPFTMEEYLVKHTYRTPRIIDYNWPALLGKAINHLVRLKKPLLEINPDTKEHTPKY